MTSDDALLQAFEACTVAPEAFSHREHVRVAWLYIRGAEHFEEAALRFCTNLRRYVARLGKADRSRRSIRIERGVSS